MLLAALICAVLAGSGFDSTVSAQSLVDYDADDDGLIEVTTEAQLNAIRWDLDGSGVVDASANATSYSAAFPNAATQMGCTGGCEGYELAADISLTSSTGMGWEPIGNSTTRFNATFEGNGRTISNLFINRTTADTGLFGHTGSASAIRNVTLTSVNVTGSDNVGALVGLNGVSPAGGRIDNCEATGRVIGTSDVGGLVGENYGPISGSSASVAVNIPYRMPGTRVGGLVGQNLEATISNSHARGDVTGGRVANSVGGLVGFNYDELAWTTAALPRNAISGSTASGTVTGGGRVGGLVGSNNGPISDSAALNPSVTGEYHVGGLVGYNWDSQADGSNAISGSTAHGAVTGGTQAGGLVGLNNGPISDSAALNPSVSGSSDVGGLVGRNNDAQADGSNAISGSTAHGAVTATGTFAGGLVGWNNGPISGSVATGSVTGTAFNPIDRLTGVSYVGGLVGQNNDAQADGSNAISGSTARGIVTTTGNRAGGLVGWNNGPISDSAALNPSVTGVHTVGGLVGLNNAPISTSRASADVTATRTDDASLAGGLVGENLEGTISNSHASGNVTGSHNRVGGLVGHNFDELASTSSTPPTNAISGSTARGIVTGGSEVGGLVGWNNGPISVSAALNPSVSGANYVGGLVGRNDNVGGTAPISGSTARGIVTGGNEVGGLVGWNNGPISDSAALNPSVSGANDVGGLVGFNSAPISGSTARGTVTATGSEVGGLVGWNNGPISGSVATGSVTGAAARVGGLVGQNQGSISRSAATGAVSGDLNVGGLVGYDATNGYVVESWASGAVSGTSFYVGGLVGFKTGGTVGASFATGNVTGVVSAGGLIGENGAVIVATYATGSVTVSDITSCFSSSCRRRRVAGGLIGFAVVRGSVNASYSTGSVSGSSNQVVGGLAGRADRSALPADNASFTNSYWDTETSGPTFGVGSDDVDDNGAIDGTETATAGVTGQTTTALKAPTGYTGIFANWNVSVPGVAARTGGPWDFGAATDYPVLRGLGAPPAFPAGTATLSVAEERAANTQIGSPLTATATVGDALSYKLVGAGAVFFSIDPATGQLSTKTRLDYENPVDANRDNEYELMVQARDGMTVAFRAVAVSVTDAIENDYPPTIAGSAAVTVAENSTAVATYEAEDPDGATSTFTWSLAGNDAGAFSISDSGVLTFNEAPNFEIRADFNRDNVYEVTVQASDGGLTGEFEVLVTVEDVNEPADISFVATGGVTVNDNALTVDENHDGTLATFRARDPESKPGLTYEWSVDMADYFVIRAGVLSFKNIPDYELPAGGTTSYDIAVSALDSDGETGSIAVTVTVEPVDEPPGITLASAAGGDVTVRGSAVSVDENHTGDLVEVTATDPEGTHTDYTFALGGTHSGSFTLSSTGGLRFTNPPDHEARDVYRLRLTASNASESSTLNVTVTVRDVNEPPVIGGEAEVSRNEVEDPRPGQVVTVGTYSKSDPDRPSQTTNWGPAGSSMVLSGADSAAFTFDQQTGRLTFASPPDYENAAQYQVTLTANDGTEEGALDVTVTVANLEETGTLTFVGEVTQGANGVLLQATLTDPDVVATETWVWQRRTGTSGPWMDIANTNASYTPSAADIGQYLRARVTYTDGAGTNETTLTVATQSPTLNDTSGNQPPTPPDPLPQVDAIEENDGGRNVARVVFTDPEGERLTYSLDGSSEFAINTGTGQITVKSGGLDYENTPSHEVTVKAADPLGASATATLTVDVMDVNEPPTAVDLPVTVGEDETVDIDVVGRASDQDAGDTLTVAGVVSSPGKGRTTVNDGTNDITYAPQANYNGADSFTYRVNDQGGLPSNTATVTITVDAVNDAPVFSLTAPVPRTVSESATESDNVGAPVVATDIDGDTPTYSLFGTHASLFEIDSEGQITVGQGTTFNIGTQETYEVTVEADDGSERARIDVTITVVAGPVVPPPTSGGGGGFGGGGGGGGPSGPSPSEVDFEWTVKRDIEELDSGHDTPTGLWSDGSILWILENGEGADDAVYAYDQATGERVEGREFALAETNRAPRGFWSNGETVWVSDSGRERLFAYGLASGEREERREVELAERNSDARGIWSDEETMWVLDGGKDSLFAYDLATGDLLAEYSLASRNGDPQGIWSDGVTVWVSDHGAKQLLAYRLPTRPDAPAAEDEDETEDPVSVPVPLERVDDEDFTELSSSSNNSPRGIWSDGDFMYVADESDDRVYTYNIPDAIDARLATLTLSGVDIGEFDPGRTEYEGTVGDGVTETTVEVTAVQRRTSVEVLPDDVDGDEENGHRVSLGGGAEITVTVTSPDGSRERVYRVAFEAPPVQLALAPTWTSIEWPGADEVTTAEAGLPDTVVAIYTWDEESRSWLAYFPGLEGVPGLNTLATFSTGATYWVAVGEGASWSVEAAPAER